MEITRTDYDKFIKTFDKQKSNFLRDLQIKRQDLIKFMNQIKHCKTDDDKQICVNNYRNCTYICERQYNFINKDLAD